MSTRNVERTRNAIWQQKEPLEEPIESETIVEELREVGTSQNANAFSSENLIVDDDFKLKMDVSLVIVILQNALLQVSDSSSIN